MYHIKTGQNCKYIWTSYSEKGYREKMEEKGGAFFTIYVFFSIDH